MRTFIPSNPGEGGRCSLYAASERPRPRCDQRRFILRTNEPGTPEVHGAGRFAGGGRPAPGPRAGRNSGRRGDPAAGAAVRQRRAVPDDRDTSRGADAHIGPRTQRKQASAAGPGTTGTEAAERAAHRSTRRTAGGPGGASGRERPASANNTARQPHDPLTTGPANQPRGRLTTRPAKHRARNGRGRGVPGFAKHRARTGPAACSSSNGKLARHRAPAGPRAQSLSGLRRTPR